MDSDSQLTQYTKWIQQQVNRGSAMRLATWLRTSSIGGAASSKSLPSAIAEMSKLYLCIEDCFAI